MRRKPGTDTKFPAQFAGNWLSVPGFARGICCMFVVPPKRFSTRHTTVMTNLRHNRHMESVVVRDSAIMSGAPTFRGTRVLVRTLFDYIEAGHSLERFLAGFPTVSREQALQALEEAKESLLASH